MSRVYEFEAILVKGPQLGLYAVFPYDCLQEFGMRRAIPVKINLDGYKTEMNLLPAGKGKHWLQFKKAITDAIGKMEGDAVKIKLEKNDNPAKIKIPDYLEWLLENDEQMMKAFVKSSASVKKFWVGYIEETKNEDVKVERINNFIRYLQTHYSG
jgi:uncharacterized protein YdeI (YjbR/CyaY-like superfamily)